MPRKAEWIHQIERVVRELERISDPYICRSMVQALFHVSPRQAVRILNRLGSGATGKSLLMDRFQMIERLRALAFDEDVQFEFLRREKLEMQLDRVRSELQARRRPIQVPEELAVDGLPAGVHLMAGCLTIDFRNAEELLSRLFAFAQTVAADVDGFERRLL